MTKALFFFVIGKFHFKVIIFCVNFAPLFILW